MTIQRPTAFLIVAVTLLASAPRFIAAQAPVPSQSPIPHPGYKSQGTALMWSLVGTAVPVGLSFAMASDYGDNAGPGLLFLAGVLIGPSLGHFYAARPGRAMAGIGVRTLAVAGFAAGFAAAWDNDSPTGAALAFGSVIGGGIAVAWDILRAPHSAEVHNEERRPLGVRVALTASPTASGARLGAKLSF